MKWLLTWLWYKPFLPLFMGFPQSRCNWLSRSGHGLTRLCTGAAQRYISLTPPKTSRAYSFLHTPSPFWEKNKGLGWKHKLWHAAWCAALTDSVLSSPHITRQKLDSWLKTEICFQLPSHPPHLYGLNYLNLDLKKLFSKRTNENYVTSYTIY